MSSLLRCTCCTRVVDDDESLFYRSDPWINQELWRKIRKGNVALKDAWRPTQIVAGNIETVTQVFSTTNCNNGSEYFRGVEERCCVPSQYDAVEKTTSESKKDNYLATWGDSQTPESLAGERKQAPERMLGIDFANADKDSLKERHDSSKRILCKRDSSYDNRRVGRSDHLYPYFRQQRLQRHAQTTRKEHLDFPTASTKPGNLCDLLDIKGVRKALTSRSVEGEDGIGDCKCDQCMIEMMGTQKELPVSPNSKDSNQHFETRLHGFDYTNIAKHISQNGYNPHDSLGNADVNNEPTKDRRVSRSPGDETESKADWERIDTTISRASWGHNIVKIRPSHGNHPRQSTCSELSLQRPRVLKGRGEDGMEEETSGQNGEMKLITAHSLPEVKLVEFLMSRTDGSALPYRSSTKDSLSPQHERGAQKVNFMVPHSAGMKSSGVSHLHINLPPSGHAEHQCKQSEKLWVKYSPTVKRLPTYPDIKVINPYTFSFKKSWSGDLLTIGEGVSGVVYKGLLTMETGNTITVCLKKYNRRNPGQEYMIYKRLEVTGVVPRVYGVLVVRDEHENESFALVMDYVANGMTLFRYFKNATLKYKPNFWIRVSLRIVQAVKEVHARGVLINDIKADNVLVEAVSVGSDAKIYLIDFGEATTLLTAKTIRPVPIEEQVTYTHIAPEVLNGSATTTASDVYSIGRLLLEICKWGPVTEKNKSIRKVERLASKCYRRWRNDRITLDELLTELKKMENET